MEFKAGDRVRLKAKPGCVGVVQRMSSVGAGEAVYCSWMNSAAYGWRFPEELELAPLSAEELVGKRVTSLNEHVRGVVLAWALWGGVEWVFVGDSRYLEPKRTRACNVEVVD